MPEENLNKCVCSSRVACGLCAVLFKDKGSQRHVNSCGDWRLRNNVVYGRGYCQQTFLLSINVLDTHKHENDKRRLITYYSPH